MMILQFSELLISCHSALTFPVTGDDYTDLDHIPPRFLLQVKEPFILHTEAIPHV